MRSLRYHTFMYLVVLLFSFPDDKRIKLEPLSVKGIFVGYSETSKAYRIYIPTQRKKVVSRDVKFDEDAWSSTSKEPPTKVEEGEKLFFKMFICK